MIIAMKGVFHVILIIFRIATLALKDIFYRHKIIVVFLIFLVMTIKTVLLAHKVI